MKLLIPPPALRAHLLATLGLPGHRQRVVGICVDPSDEPGMLQLRAVILCARAHGCPKCAAWLAPYDHVELGVILNSKVEVNRIADAEPTAPAATDEFPA